MFLVKLESMSSLGSSNKVAQFSIWAAIYSKPPLIERHNRRKGLKNQSAVAVWRSNRGFTVCHVYDHGNNESSKLFWSIRKGKVGMINNS